MLNLAPYPSWSDKPRRGSPRMFRADLVEKYSRVRPWQVFAIWVPFAAWSLWQGIRQSSGSWLTQVAFAVVGLLAWTLLEYGLHRYLFHFVPSPKSEIQNDISYLIHGIHHSYPWDGDRLVFPPPAAAVILFVLWWPLKFLFCSFFYAAIAGIILGYVWYDLTHYYLHHGKPTLRAVRWQRSYHLRHHFAEHDVRYGITTPLWDLVFGTYPKKEAASVTANDDLVETPSTYDRATPRGTGS